METPAGNGDTPIFHLQAAENDIQIDLNLTSSKPAVLPDNIGLFAGSADPGNTFYFYWLPRLTVRGKLQMGAEQFSVTGLAWLDRAWGAVSLTRGQIALNRFALQLDDGREVLCFQLHRRDGSGVPITTALLVSRDGTTQSFSRHDLSLEALDYWTSSQDASRYPARWQLHIPAAEMKLTITPYLADQEMDFAIRYWGGAVQVSGQADGRSLNGSGYVELTGYGERMARR
jgi:predicted secreted hydrolase